MKHFKSFIILRNWIDKQRITLLIFSLQFFIYLMGKPLLRKRTVLKVLVSALVALFVHFQASEYVEFLRTDETKRVRGPLYGTCAPTEQLQDLNEEIRPILSQLTVSQVHILWHDIKITIFLTLFIFLQNKSYFSTFKVNMEKECPFWAQQRMCNSNKCSICECDDKEIPLFWKKQQEEDESVMKEMSYGH